MSKTITGGRPELRPVNVGAAAIDIGSKTHMAAVDPTCTDPVRAFGTFTQDLHDLADWFKACGVTSVAMESTGVYWIPAYEILEQRGFEVILVNARYAKNVPGRKTDVSDAAWLRQLHSYGLLRGSFRPNAEIATLRTYLRQRERLVEYAAAHIQHMQKALMERIYNFITSSQILPARPGCGLSEQSSRASAIPTCWRPTAMCDAIPPPRQSGPL
jgi:transposase